MCQNPIRRRLQQIRGSSGRNVTARGRSFASVVSGASHVPVIVPATDSVSSVPSVSEVPATQPIPQASSDISPCTGSLISPSVGGSECKDCSETLSSLSSRLDRLSDLFIASLQALVSIKKFSSIREISQLLKADDFPVPKRGQVSEICQLAADKARTLAATPQGRSRKAKGKSTARARSRANGTRISPDSAKRRKHVSSTNREDHDMSDLDDPDYEPAQ